MTQTEMKTRIAHYEQSLKQGRITAKEFDGFIEALARIMAREGR